MHDLEVGRHRQGMSYRGKTSAFQLVSYFTNIAVQNVNKGFVYITDWTSSLPLEIQ